MAKPIDRTALKLAKLKSIVEQFVADDNTGKHLSDLKQFAELQYFYAHHTFAALLDVLSNHRDLPESKVTDVFTLLNGILFDGPDKKDSIIGQLYHIVNKKRLDLLDNLTSMCASEKELITTKPDVLIGIRENLVRQSTTEDQRRRIYKSYQGFLKTHAADGSLVLKQLEYFNRLVTIFMGEHRWEDLVIFLTDTILYTASKKDLSVTSDEIFEQLFTTLMLLLNYGHAESAVMELGRKLTKTFDAKMLTNADQKNCNALLMKVFKMCSAGTFNEAAFKEIHSKHFKNPKATQSEWHQRSVMQIAKLFTHKLPLFEKSPECFDAYQILVIGFFYTFKTIANKEGVVACCADVKRHESHSAIKPVYSLVLSLIKEGHFTEVIAKRLIYHAKYDTQLCSDLKCKSKDIELNNTYLRLFSVLRALHSHKSIIHKHFNQIHELLQLLFKLWNSIPDGVKAEHSQNPFLLTLGIYCEPKCEETAKISANGLASLLIHQIRNIGDYSSATKESKKLLMQNTPALRVATKQLKFESASAFIESDQFKDGAFSSSKLDLPVAEFILIEMRSLFRYSPGHVEAVGPLFGKLCGKTNDPHLLAQACQLINESTLNFIDTKDFRKANELLEAREKKLLHLKEFDLGNSLALALNNYSTYITMSEAVISELKVNSTATVSVSKLNLQAELDQLKYLNKSQEHFADVVRHLEKQRQDVDKIISMTRVQSVLNNMATQFFLRGIKYKDLETFTLLWKLIALNTSPAAPTDNSNVSASDSSKQSEIHILNIGTFFLDHSQMLTDSSGNYVRLSEKMKPLTIDEILDGANKALDNELIPSFDNLAKSSQFYVLSYVLSLWVHYVTTGKRTVGFKRYEQFKKMWMSASSNQEFLQSRAIIEAKLYFCGVEIEHKCSHRDTVDYLSIACGKIMSITTFEKDFSYQFYQIYHRIISEVIVRSNIRLSDMDHYNQAMISLIHLASKKGHCLKALDLLSLSITRYLNMEKIAKAMTQLQEISKLLGLNEEILIETGTKTEPVPAKLVNLVPTVLEYATVERIRKQVVAPSSPIQCELSVINENNSLALSDQLKSFMHQTSCGCEICKIPRLKFIMFQIGCHYARLLWMVGKFDVSLKFHELAFKEYRIVSDELRFSNTRNLLMLSRTSFAEYSFHWLLQYVDTLIRLEEYEECEKILQHVEHNCTSSHPDYGCLKEALHCRKENVAFLIEHGSLREEKKQETGLTFEGFLNARLEARRAKSDDKPKVAATKAGDITKAGDLTKAGDKTKPEDTKMKQKTSNLSAISKRPVPVMATPTTKNNDVVFVDSDDDSYPMKPPSPKKPAPKSVKRPAKRANEKVDEPMSTRRTAKVVEVIEIDLTNDSSSGSASSIPASARKTRRRI